MNFELLNVKESQYHTFRISKGNGKYRVITAPSEEMKAAQREVVKYLEDKIQLSRYAMGFIQDKSILTNAQHHVGKAYILNIDLKDFFPSITEQMVVDVLIREGIEPEMAKNIADLCTLNSVLPQGAPSSPFLSNLVAKQMDEAIGNLSDRVTYTRYADDMTLSGEREDVLAIKQSVLQIISSYGFIVNWRKIRAYHRGCRQEVTGVVVNEKPNLNRTDTYNFRAKLHNIRRLIKEGEIKSKQDLVDKVGDTVDNLRGYASFVKSLNPQRGQKFLEEIKAIEESLIV